MSVHSQMINRMEEFLSCRMAEEHPNGRLHQEVERPSIMISREAGARGLEIGAKLVDYLTQFDDTAEHGWALFDQSLVTRVIETKKLPEVIREYLTPVISDTRPHEVIDTMHGTPPSEWTLFQHSADVIRRLCQLGNVIILGRGANFLTQDLPNAFHIRLVGDPDDRAKALANTLGLSQAEALAYVESTDLARASYVRRHLHREINDPAAYHLMLNASRLDESTAARIIGDSLMEWACGRSQTMTR